MRGARPDRALVEAFSQRIALSPGEHLLVALSGGSDSVALAALCADVARAHEARVTLAHVHHGTRASAALDEGVACSIAARLGLPLEVRRLEPGGTGEARLRRERYARLAVVAEECGAKRLLTAHTADDQTETVLLALFRGTGRDGLRGMPARRELAGGVMLERPLLFAERSELRRFSERRHLPYVIDPTNADTGYRRNAVRAALHRLRPLFPGLDRSVARCADLLNQECEQPEIRAQAQEVRRWLKEHGMVSDVSRERLGAVLQLLELGRGRRVRLMLDKEDRPDDRGSSARRDNDGAKHDVEG